MPERFAEDVRGNVAIMAALCMTLLLAFVGAGIDFNRSNNVYTDLQNAADAAALAGASARIDDKDRKRVAEATFDAEAKLYGINAEVTRTVTVSADTEVVVRAKGVLKTSLLGIIGKKTLNASVVSVAKQTFLKPEVALVLDVSGSMNASMGTGARIDVLKTAANELIDTLAANAQPGSLPKYAVVPFNMNVNVGTSNAAIVQNTNNPLFAGTSWAGCVLERAAPHTNSDTFAAGSTGSNGLWQAYVHPPEPNRDGVCTNQSDGTNTGYAAVETNAAGQYKVQTAGPNYNCVRHPIMALTSDPNAAKTKINQLTAEYNMGTIIAPGVAWGMRVLSPSAPFTEGDPANDKVRKIIVVLTDGAQTTEASYGTKTGCEADANTTTPYAFDPASLGLDGAALAGAGPEDEFSAYGYIKDSDPFGSSPATWTDVDDDLHDVSIDACEVAKSKQGANAEIFSIAVSTAAGPGTRVYDLLKACATDANHFYYAADSAALKDAFKQIADEVINVRLYE